MTKKSTNKKTVAEIVTQRFIDALEGGKIPWIKPWNDWTSWSRATGKDYQGCNALNLSGGEYITFKQAKDQGITINKGAKAEMIVKYTDYRRKITQEEYEKHELLYKYANPEKTEDGKIEVDARSIRYYNVFNVEACTDAEQKHEHKQTRHEWDSIEKAEEIASGYIKRSGVKITEASNQPCYRPLVHEIETGRKEQFSRPAEYYSTLFHEMVHSTKKAAGRPLVTGKGKERAREELIAEIGAAYIMSYLGIESEFSVKNSTAYVQSWAEALKNDPNAILYAAPKAIEAANIILNIQ